MGSDTETEKKKTPVALAPIAKPLAGKKLSKRTLKLVRRASEAKCLKRGVKEVVKSIRRGNKGLCVIAGNISPIDGITHVPILCEEANIPYIYVTSKEELATAGTTKRPTCCVLVMTKPAKGEISEEVKEKLQSDYDQVVTEVAEVTSSIVKEGKSSVEPNDTEDILHENQDEEAPSADFNQLAAQSEIINIGDPGKAKRGKKNKTKKVKQSGEVTKTNMPASSKGNKLGRHFEVDTARHVVVDTANVDEIPSVDEDCSRGMKKWILEYKQKRPGLKILQQRIDEFITSHEEQQEQERKEREARAAEDGWTVVVHHKGRKKTTDTETGTAVGSVSLAAMQEKISKKKPKEVGVNFYRFQKREAQITELAMLQSKFEQDKKRIQQLRAQRKFKPY